HVITHAGKIFYAAAAYEHNRMLLQVVADAGDIRRHFDSIGQPLARHFAQSRVRLFRRLRVHASANPPLLRTPLQRRTGRLVPWPLTAITHQLIKRRHSCRSFERAGSLEASSAQRNSAFPGHYARSGTGRPESQPYFSLCTNAARDSGFLFQTYAADGGTRPKLRGRSVSSAVPCISFRKPLGIFIRCGVAPSIG